VTQLSQADVTGGQRRLGRNFWLLFGGQGLSLVGSETVIVAAPVVAVTVLHASAIQIGILSAAQTVAFLLVALPAGLLVDRVGAWPAMWWSDAVRTVLAGSVAVLVWTSHLGFAGFAVLTAATGAFAVLFDVAYPTFLPQVVPRDLLPSANSRLSGMQSVAQVSGPPVGGVLVGAAGPGGAFLLDSISFVMSLASLGVIGRPRRVEPDERAAREPWFRALTNGLRFVWSERILRAGILWSGTANIFVVMVETMGVLYLLRNLRFSAALVGLLLAFGAAGGVLGALLVRRINAALGTNRATWMAMTIFALPGLLIPLAQRGPGALLFGIGWMSWSLSATLTSINLMTYRQRVTPGPMLGRVNAAARWVTWGTLPAGGLIGGLLGSWIGVHTTLWLAVVGGCLSGLWLFFSPLRTGMSLEADHDATAGDLVPE